MPVGDLKLIFKPNIDEFAMDSCAFAHNTINTVYEMVKINQYFQMYIETKVIIENNVVDTLCLAKWLKHSPNTDFSLQRTTKIQTPCSLFNFL